MLMTILQNSINRKRLMTITLNKVHAPTLNYNDWEVQKNYLLNEHVNLAAKQQS